MLPSGLRGSARQTDLYSPPCNHPDRNRLDILGYSGGGSTSLHHSAWLVISSRACCEELQLPSLVSGADYALATLI